jgi:flagellar assembly protein FliH
MMAQVLMLEDFDRSIPEQDTLSQAPESLPGYAEGFRSGREAGLAEAGATQDRLTALLADRFADISFTQAEARAHVLAALRPLFTAVTGKLLPQAAQASLAPYVAEALIEAAAADTRSPVALLVAPEVAEVVRAVAERQAGNPVIIEANPGLGAGEVLIRSSERETMLDIDRLVEELQGALGALFVGENRRERHG